MPKNKPSLSRFRDITPERARSIQQEWAGQVIKQDSFTRIRYVAGVDVGYRDDVARAAVVVLRFPRLDVHETAIAERSVSFPYIPGLLFFREAPTVLDAIQKLNQTPDLLLYDGHGVAHPRRFGVASFVGVLTDLPTIGVAKKRLIGDHEPLPSEKGNWVHLMENGEIIGAVVRSRSGVKPVYVSVGHKISLPTAVDVVLTCTTRFRLPETTRWAHRLAG